MSSQVQSRLYQEWNLLKYYWWKMLLMWTVVMYFCSVVARNLAFMHHHPISYYVNQKNESFVRLKRLEDLGFKIIPDWSDSYLARALNDFFAVLSPMSVILFSFLTMLSKRASNRKVFTVNIIVRFSMCYATAHLIRTCAYLTTSLPGPAVHCIDTKLESTNKPKSLADIFLSMNFPHNCGDLLYSGHMAGYITGFCTVAYYVEKIFNKDEKLTKCRRFRLSTATNLVIALYTIGMLCQVALAIGSRQHYTVDTLLAIFAGYWNFIWHLYVLRPSDMYAPKSLLSEYQKPNSKPRLDSHKKEALDESDLSLTQKLLGECISC